jgi:enoyl-CoA hydratase
MHAENGEDMSESVVVTEVRNRSLWIRLNRPDAMNSLTPEVLQAIEKGLDQALECTDVMTVVLTGNGRAFCAGHTMNRLDRFPKPVIASLNGITLAGGLELVLCCDLVIAAKSAKIGDAHANYGLLPGGGGSVRLPRVIGPTRAKYLLYTGEFVSAEEMREAGLVNQVVDDSQLDAATQKVADTIATKSPLGLQRMKALVDDGLDQSEDTALRLELLASEVHAFSADLQEGLEAFQGKRAPRFTGK